MTEAAVAALRTRLDPSVGVRVDAAGAWAPAARAVRLVVPAGEWVQAATVVHEEDTVAATFFDWLSAYVGADGLVVVLHVWSRRHRLHVLMTTELAGEAPVIDSVTGVWPGADWHERETTEMFGVVFAGHPDPRPLLLPEGFDGHPLRKEFLLGARQVTPWPGAVEPAPTAATAAPRRRSRLRPPGVGSP